MTVLFIVTSIILLTCVILLYQDSSYFKKLWLHSMSLHTECINEKFDCYLQIAKLEATIRSLEHEISLYEQMRHRTFDE